VFLVVRLMTGHFSPEMAHVAYVKWTNAVTADDAYVFRMFLEYFAR
jgi:hypothetical protein